MANQNIMSGQENLPDTRELISNGYIVHNPITILDDFDFDLYSFLGDGTKTNPYIIENLNITHLYKGIVIYDTTKYFIIRNCYFETGETGISLSDNANGTATLINNTFVNNIRAMELFGLSGLTVINNTGYGNCMGIDLWKNYNSLIKNNYFFGVGTYIPSYSYGIRAYSLHHSQIINNTIENCESGIVLLNSNINYLINNTIIECQQTSSIELEKSNYNIVMGNTILNNTGQDGIRLKTASLNILSYNHIENCTNYSINVHTTDCKENIIHHNNLINNTDTGSQGKDNGLDNIWEEEAVLEGNFWSDWSGTGNYSLDGTSGNFDYHPLNETHENNWSIITIPTHNIGIDDEFEENDYFEAAKTIAVNNTYTLVANDDDYFKITLQRYETLKLNVTFIWPDVGLHLALLDSEGRFVFGADGVESPQTLSFTSFIMNGDFIIEIYVSDSSTFSPNYNFSITMIPDDRPDDIYEDNDVIEDAITLDPNNKTYSLVYSDIDFFKIELVKNQNVHIAINFDNSITDLELFLVTKGPAGIDEILVSSESSNSFEVVEYSVKKNGDFYIQVKSTDLVGIPLFSVNYTLVISTTVITLGFYSYVFIPVFIVPLICLVVIRKRK
ncbi:MAG: hypothetical protein GPJ52_11185 [Candidatus Heimdallarchaeota archaeon]|nr:hypothetical protein [Candidatus Heimdallarchaeota archaeon]